MRGVAVCLTFAAVAAGSVALAQPSWVAEPWHEPSSVEGADSWFGPTQTADTRSAVNTPPAPDARSPRDGASRAHGPWAVPAAEPATPAESHARVDFTTGVLVVDPWRRVPAAHDEPEPTRDAAIDSVRIASVPAEPWATRIVEVVDPWSHAAPLTHGTALELVVDPWQR